MVLCMRAASWCQLSFRSSWRCEDLVSHHDLFCTKGLVQDNTLKFRIKLDADSRLHFGVCLLSPPSPLTCTTELPAPMLYTVPTNSPVCALCLHVHKVWGIPPHKQALWSLALRPNRTHRPYQFIGAGDALLHMSWGQVNTRWLAVTVCPDNMDGNAFQRMWGQHLDSAVSPAKHVPATPATAAPSLDAPPSPCLCGNPREMLQQDAVGVREGKPSVLGLQYKGKALVCPSGREVKDHPPDNGAYR